MRSLRLNLVRGTYSFVIFLAVVGLALSFQPKHARAATTIVVNSKADTVADDGECTLREAIIAANTDSASGVAVGECAAGSGTDTINFAITGVADFTISGQNGYTITPAGALPDITQPITINGYSQTGALANTAVAPNPLNGRLLIEIDGSSTGGASIIKFVGSSSGSSMSGLVLNRSSAGGILTNASNLIITGNYIGTNPTGTAGLVNTGAGLSSTTPLSAAGTRIGGTNPADRNLISGNNDSGGYPQTDWVVQGNYVGVAADGVTAIPNSLSGGAGAFSIDNCNNVQIGGTAVGAMNVVSGNNSHGLAPDNCTNLKIEGNYVGTDYTGTVAVPNESGIVISGDQTGSIIGGTVTAARNIVSGNTIAGIISGTTGNLHIEGNYVGLNKNGDAPIPNGTGILYSGTTVIGGSVAGRNVISGNTTFNVSAQGLLSPTNGSEISGNYIGTNAAGNIAPAITAAQGEGVRITGNVTDTLVGGTYPNVIAGNRGSGVAIRSLTISSFSVTLTPNNNPILGNAIYGNTTGGPIATAQGLGIDLYEATVATLSFPADIQADTYVKLGLTPNDASDPDTGPNNYMNFPVISSATQTGTALSVNFDLDAADSTNSNYRVEFFANDNADPSGYGEGQTYLGSTTVSNGVGQTANLTMPNGTNLTGKVISATTTAVNNTAPSGFGATSEFSQVHNIDVVTVSTPDLAGTGQNLWLWILGAVTIVTTGLWLGRRALRR